MNLENYLQTSQQTVSSFAEKHDIPATTTWRATKRKVVRPQMALRISEATGGAVTMMELLFPDKPGDKAT